MQHRNHKCTIGFVPKPVIKYALLKVTTYYDSVIVFHPIPFDGEFRITPGFSVSDSVTQPIVCNEMKGGGATVL